MSSWSGYYSILDPFVLKSQYISIKFAFIRDMAWFLTPIPLPSAFLTAICLQIWPNFYLPQCILSIFPVGAHQFIANILALKNVDIFSYINDQFALWNRYCVKVQMQDRKCPDPIVYIEQQVFWHHYYSEHTLVWHCMRRESIPCFVCCK